jgi:hypothetical protein
MPARRPVLNIEAFIDESGQRASTRRSSDHFVMAAVITPRGNLAGIAQRHEDLRRELGRSSGDMIHWRNLKTHSHRVVAARSVAAMPLQVCAVVVCKRHLIALPHEDKAYLFTLRLLLERISWYAQRHHSIAAYTLAHIVRFKLSQLRQYENKLKSISDCHIEWAHMNPSGGRIDQPKNVEQLQLADIAASAIAKAFEPDEYGITERRYLEELRPALWCPTGRPLTSYGLKMHPWNEATQGAYPWVATV